MTECFESCAKLALRVLLAIAHGLNMKVRTLASIIMVALCNRADHYIFILFLLSFISSPNLSRRRLDVYHTLAHGVALVRI